MYSSIKTIKKREPWVQVLLGVSGLERLQHVEISKPDCFPCPLKCPVLKMWDIAWGNVWTAWGPKDMSCISLLVLTDWLKSCAFEIVIMECCHFVSGRDSWNLLAQSPSGGRKCSTRLHLLSWRVCLSHGVLPKVQWELRSEVIIFC